MHGVHKLLLSGWMSWKCKIHPHIMREFEMAQAIYVFDKVCDQSCKLSTFCIF